MIKVKNLKNQKRLFYGSSATSKIGNYDTDFDGLSGYFNKVTRLIPSEIIAAYLAMIGFSSGIGNYQTQFVTVLIIFFASLILTPIYISKIDRETPSSNYLILSTLAFLVWAYVTTGQQLSDTTSINFYDQALASIILILFSLISGLITVNKKKST